MVGDECPFVNADLSCFVTGGVWWLGLSNFDSFEKILSDRNINCWNLSFDLVSFVHALVLVLDK
jgi:hypothetical protein